MPRLAAGQALIVWLFAVTAIGISLLALVPWVGIGLFPALLLAVLVVAAWAFVTLTRGARSLPKHTSPREPDDLGHDR